MSRHKPVRWEAYAEAYDVMATYNPAYQENIERFSAEIRNWRIDPGDILLDVGGGTGNYSIAMARAFPRSQVWHVDANPGMNAVARQKARKHRLDNFRVIQADVNGINIAPRTIKAVVCVNALYCMPRPRQLIHRIYQWMQPDGYLYVDDVGRVVKLHDWFGFILKAVYRRFGLLRTCAMVVKGREVIFANRRIAVNQRSGKFWTHDMDHFTAAFREAGFAIGRTFVGYRSYSDGLVCRKPDDAEVNDPVLAAPESCARSSVAC